MPHNTGGESSGGTGSPPELDQNQGTEQVLRLPMLSSRRLGRRSAEVSRASHLECWAVVGGAENQLAAAKDTVRLQTRGILYAPDYVVNVGGALFVLGVEIEVVESLRPALWQVSGLTAIGRSEKWVLDFRTLWHHNDHGTGSAMQQHPEHDQADAHGLTVAIIAQESRSRPPAGVGAPAGVC